MPKKGCNGCLVAIAATIIILLLMFRACTGRNTLNKEQIIQFVLDNEELLNQAIDEIWGLDDYVSSIAHTRFSRLHPRDGFDFEGLYTRGVINSEVVRKPLDNPILYELLRDGRITSITIIRPDPTRGTTHHIQFNFNVRGFWDRRGGIYFSKNDEPTQLYGRRWANPEEYRNGWVSYGNHFYYTERIIPHWFYYEMLYNSTRTPRR